MSTGGYRTKRPQDSTSSRSTLRSWAWGELGPSPHHLESHPSDTRPGAAAGSHPGSPAKSRRGENCKPGHKTGINAAPKADPHFLPGAYCPFPSCPCSALGPGLPIPGLQEEVLPFPTCASPSRGWGTSRDLSQDCPGCAVMCAQGSCPHQRIPRQVIQI